MLGTCLVRDFFQGLVDNIKGAARSAVSGDKMRFQNGGFDLDLCYITPRIIGAWNLGSEFISKNMMVFFLSFFSFFFWPNCLFLWQ
jgi:hypothetical protein